MIKKLILILFVSCQLAFPHAGGHGREPITSSQALVIASEYVTALLNQGIKVEGTKLDQSWKNISDKSLSIHAKGEDYYIVSFNNKELGNKLYLLISNRGEFYDANYSGSFKDLSQ